MEDASPSPIDYAQPKTRVPKKPLSSAICWIVAVCAILGPAFVAISWFVPTDSTAIETADHVLHVTKFRPWVITALWWMTPLGLVLPLVGGVLLLSRRRLFWGIFLVVLSSIMVAAMVPIAFLSIWHEVGWVIYDQVLASDGNQYCYIDSSFLQAQTMAIARVETRGAFRQTMEVLGTTNGDSPRSYLLVVRPSPPRRGGYTSLCPAPNGLLVGIRGDNACYMVYDVPNKRFFGHGDVEELSPFLLVDGMAKLNSPDEATIIATAGSAERMGVPRKQALLDAAAHPNPEVRASAERILKAMPP